MHPRDSCRRSWMSWPAAPGPPIPTGVSMLDRRPSPSLIGVALLALLVAALSTFDGDAPNRLVGLRRLVPSLEPRFAMHLVRDDEREFMRFCERVGQSEISAQYRRIDMTIWSATPHTYRRVFSGLAPYLLRMGDAIQRMTGRTEHKRDISFRRDLGDRGIELNRCV